MISTLRIPSAFLAALFLLTPLQIHAQFTQQGGKLVGTGAVGTPVYQGVSVALSSDGNTAITGGYYDNTGAGAVWIWTRTGGVWTQQGNKLVGSGTVGNAYQGYSVSLSADGNTALVGGILDNGGAGAAWVWTRSGGVWAQQGVKLVGTGATGTAQQGFSVALSPDGNTAIVGGNADNSQEGAAWVWTRTGGVWTQQGAKLVGTGNVGAAQQGQSVALSTDGNTAVIGGNRDNSFAGAAWIWTRTGGAWTQQGSKLVGTGAVGLANQGFSVSLSGDGNTTLVGGKEDNNTAGAAWVWTRTGGVWTQQGVKLVGNDALGGALQGISVSLSADGSSAIVGGNSDNNNAGATWAWTRTGGVWTQLGSKLVGTGSVGSAYQGGAVSLSGDGLTFLVGANQDNSQTGAAWTFTRPLTPPSALSYTSPSPYTVGTTITNLTPTVTGTVTSYSSAPALPAGLSLNATTGVISGTPTVSTSATNYTITATNSGGSATAIISITVNYAAPTALSYTTPVIYTASAAIASNTPTVTGTVTSYSIAPNLPAGISINASTGVISGTPTTVAGAANYVVTATNSGGSTTATVNITVIYAAPTNLSYTSSNYPVNVAITNNSPTVTGTVTTYSVATALPTGLSLNSSTGVISGTPTTPQAPANYVVTAANNGGSTNATVSIGVLPPLPSGFYYANTPVTYTLNAAIAPNTPTITTSSITSYLVSPALPAGLSLNASTGVISGTPSVESNAANYIVTATNGGGSATATVNIKVDNAAPSNLSYAYPTPTYTLGAAITPNTPSVTGTITSYSVAPPLPAGLSIHATTGVITGTPTVLITVASNYVVTASNGGGSATSTVRITVNSAAPSALTYSNNPVTYTINASIPLNRPTVTGSVAKYSAPNLPAGLSIDTNTGFISGIPTTAKEATNYTVTATNAVGSTTATVNITVNSLPPSGLSYTTPVTYTLLAAITNNIPSVVSGSVSSFSISPTLPEGLSLNTTTGVISGNPSALSAATIYTVTATNSIGSTTAIVNITVNNAAPTGLTYNTPVTYTLNTTISENRPTVTGTVNGYSVAPPLPAGLSINTSTGIISGSPTAASNPNNYVVTATNSGGSATATVNITVNNLAPSGLSYTKPEVTYSTGKAIAPNTPKVTGTVTSYSVAPELPTGLSLNTTTGFISGIPTTPDAGGNYTITAVNGAGSTTCIVKITINNTPPKDLSYSADTAVYTINAPIAPNVPTVTGTVDSFTVTPALPNGLSMNATTGIISGVPTTKSTAKNYIIKANNDFGFAIDTINLFVNDSPPENLEYATHLAIYTVGIVIPPNVPKVIGTVTQYSIAPELPAGLSINASTGVISGIPSLSTQSHEYVVKAENGIGSTLDTIVIGVIEPDLIWSEINPAEYPAEKYPTGNSMQSVFFFNTNLGWAVGSGGAIYKTIDGGSKWAPPSQGLPTSKTLFSVFFTGTGTGFAVGKGDISTGNVFKTIDGGVSWFRKWADSTATQWMYSVQFPNPDVGYSVGYRGTIIKSMDRGETWARLTSGTTKTLYSHYFTDANLGYAVGEGGTILRTTDGGSTWTPQSSGTKETLFSVYFTRAEIGYAVGSGGVLLSTHDTGATWISHNTGVKSSLYCVRFTGLNAGYASGGSGVLLKTINGGSRWDRQLTGTTNNLYSLSFPVVDTGYAVGFSTASGVGGILKAVRITPSSQKRMAIGLKLSPFGDLGYDLPQGSEVRLQVLDLKGKLVMNRREGYQEPGRHQINVASLNLPKGSYILVFRAEGFRKTMRYRR